MFLGYYLQCIIFAKIHNAQIQGQFLDINQSLQENCFHNNILHTVV